MYPFLSSKNKVHNILWIAISIRDTNIHSKKLTYKQCTLFYHPKTKFKIYFGQTNLSEYTTYYPLICCQPVRKRKNVDSYIYKRCQHPQIETLLFDWKRKCKNILWIATSIRDTNIHRQKLTYKQCTLFYRPKTKFIIYCGQLSL